mmetsp:Transcript_7472/g.8602  ORF Transcript_7472/g.8602 Transcript_7472/m.8602 type:complete len:286 (-) Transcript_7472:131-988(-)
MKLSASLFFSSMCLVPSTVNGFSVVQPAVRMSQRSMTSPVVLYNAAEPTDEEIESALEKSKLSDEDVEKVGNLVADDEWMGLGMELSELVRVAVIEECKKNTADFIGKDEYKVGDITKEIDGRVKDVVADMRGKEEYELGDLTMGLDKIGKDMVCELTGKDDYEAGDLSTELDTRVKSSVAEFCGKDEYEVGDLTAEIDKRSRAKVYEFIGNEEYEFGDISREVENRRREWVKDFLGEEAAANYQFGDITKKALTGFTGKDEYEFGDVTKKLMGDLFGKRKRGGK